MSLARFGVNGTPGAPPPTGYMWLYMKSDKLLYFMDDTGAETPVRPVGAGTGDLLSDGTVPLVADWNVGLFKITANQLESVIATGTAPLLVASTTKVTNLNADLLDDKEAADFVWLAATTLAGAGFFLDEDNMASNDDTKVPSQQSVKAYVDAAITGLYDDKGNYDASTNTPDLDTSPSGSIQKGDVYTVSVAGDFFTIAVEAGDTVRALQDAPTLEAHWAVVQGNLVNAIVDADYSGSEGIQRKTGAGAYQVIKTNLNSATDPGVNDDSSAGYAIYSPWVNTTASPHKLFFCIDASVGAAVWQEVGSGGGLAASVQTSAYECTQSEDVGLDSTGGPFTTKLKASPVAGDVNIFRDVGHVCNTNNVTIDRNGSTIDGVAANANCNVDNGIWWFIYTGSTWNFTPIVPGGLNQEQVDARVALFAPTTGTFSPTIQDDAASDALGQTYSTQSGVYRKVGDLVTFWIDIVISGLGTLNTAQQVRIANLPFTSAAGIPYASAVCLGQSMAITAGQVASGMVSASSSKVSMFLWDNAVGVTNLLISELSVDGRLVVSGSYVAA